MINRKNFINEEQIKVIKVTSFHELCYTSIIELLSNSTER